MKNRLTGLILLLFMTLFSSSVFGSMWARSYGGSDSDSANSIQQTSDGGFIVAGATYHDLTMSRKVLVLKLNTSGNVDWQKVYGYGAVGRGGGDRANSIQQTSDGGFIVAAALGAKHYDYTSPWIIKLNSTGEVVWQKKYVGGSLSGARFIQQTSDGGFIAAGTGFPSNTYQDNRFCIWIMQLDTNGNVAWRKEYTQFDSSSTGNDASSMNSSGASSIQQTTDGGFIVAGSTFDWADGIMAYGDFWILKLDTNGNVDWQRAYGGLGNDSAKSIQQTRDGGYIVAGRTTSSSYPAGLDDCWILKLDTNGNVDWQKAYRGPGYTETIQQTTDGGFIVAGSSSILKLDTNGNVDWQKEYEYGGSGSGSTKSIQQTTDGGFIVAGSINYFGVGAGDDDIWILKLDTNGNISGCDLIRDSSLIAQDTNIIPFETDTIPTDLSDFSENASMKLQVYDAETLLLCSGAGQIYPPATYNLLLLPDD